MRHQDLIFNHIIESWTYPTAAARTGASGFVTGDVGRIAYQQDTKQYWRLASTIPAWDPITGIFSENDTAAASPSSITSSTAVMMGLGGSTTLVPTLSGKVLVHASGGVRNDTVGANGGQLSIYYGTGTAPAFNATVVGTAVSPAILWRNSADSSGCIFPFTLVGTVTGLATGTTYWFDVAASTGGTSGTVNLYQVHFTIVELP